MDSDSYKAFVLDQLDSLGIVRCLPMFGGFGFYLEDKFFGIIFRERLYFKTSPTTRKEYVRLGMKPFSPRPRQTLKSYYEVPADILENRERLLEWAKLALSQ